MKDYPLSTRDKLLGVLPLLIISCTFSLVANRLAPNTINLGNPLPALRPGDIGLAEMKLVVQNRSALVLDTRIHSRYSAYHVSGAISVPHDEFDSVYPEIGERLDKIRPIVVYCETRFCPIADSVKNKLTENGHKNVRVFRPGFRVWKAEKLEVERS